jgi:acyl-CoA synthetase (AMP-forming)/AMP-acid ligase II
VLEAFIVPRRGAALTPPAVLRFARPRIAGYKLPYAIHIVDYVPQLPSGKPDRRALARDADDRQRTERIQVNSGA